VKTDKEQYEHVKDYKYFSICNSVFFDSSYSSYLFYFDGIYNPKDILILLLLNNAVVYECSTGHFNMDKGNFLDSLQ
jgi:hypothetical protein